MSQSRGRDIKPRQSTANVPTKDLFRLDERTILITGGGGSIGLEVASSILESGGDVVCVDRAESPLEEPWVKVQRLAEEWKTKVWYYMCDVTDVEAVDALFKTATAKTRYPLRGLVTCAGISGGGPTVDFPVDKVRRIMDINVMGTFIFAQAAAKEMIKHNVTGSMVFVASMSAHGSNKGVDTTAYNTSKSAVLQLARSMAAEWGSRIGSPSIRVNSISPGYIKTRLTSETLSEPNREKEWSEDNMLNRLSTADEFRGPIMFLLSDASSFVTGADLRADGGHTAW
ncbi:oxidoreductase [Stipitochalara longipes BDJ]|nr:oxidoreductase [Stipitochalara longipes BDJ]